MPPQPPAPAARKAGSKRSRRKKSPIPAPGGVPERIRTAERSVAEAVRAAHAEMFGLRAGAVRPFSFSLEILVDPGESWRVSTIPPLEQCIRASLREMEVRADAYQDGRVYCYRCESSTCEHSVPPRPGSVFGGYTPTGRPAWPDLLQVLLEQRHPNIDRLFLAGSHDLAVLCIPPDTLKQRQMAIFGRESKTYDILGQIVFGFLDMAAPEPTPGGDRERVAFTVQAVASRGRNGSPRLALNVLGRLSCGTPALDAVQGSFQTRVFHTIASARRTLRSMAMAPAPAAGAPVQPPGAPPLPSAQVMNFLAKLARNLERVGRQRGRRTDHAEERRVTRRHSSSAHRDLLRTPADTLLWDAHRQTVVVVGPRNRVHVFTPDARHVTSMLLSIEELNSRRRRKRWVPLTEEQRLRFAQALDAAPPSP